MALEARVTLNRIEYDLKNNVFAVRLDKEIVNIDTGVVIQTEYHRTTVQDAMDEEGKLVARGDVGAQMKLVNNHLEALGYPPVADEDTALLGALKVSIEGATTQAAIAQQAAVAAAKG